MTQAKLFQRHWTWWFMVVVLVIIAAARLRLLNFPLERDEGEYAYSGQLLLQGIPPYELAYNMKFPGTYAAYAFIMKIFGETPAGIHFGLMLLTTATALMLFWLGKKILDETAGAVAASVYGILAASPSMLGLAGHATHFVAFFVTLGMCLMWRARQNVNWLFAFASGIAFGVAVLMKQHAVIIGAWAGIAFAMNCFSKKESLFSKKIISIAACAAGMILPLVACCLILWRMGVFESFWFWTVDYARQYASVVPISYAPRFFWIGFHRTLTNEFLMWLVAAAGCVLLWFEARLKPARLWIFGFAAASALAVCPDFYFRKHYFLLALPAVALLAGVAVAIFNRIAKEKLPALKICNWPLIFFAVFAAATILMNANAWFSKSPQQLARDIYGTDPLPEAAIVADFIKKNSAPGARIAILGSEPQIYFLSQRHSATAYIYVYGLMEPQPFALQMQNEMIQDIETSAPQIIVYAQNLLSWNRQPDSNSKIFNWWDGYKTNYTLIGIADVLSMTNTIYAFGTNWTTRYSEAHGRALEVYERLPLTTHKL